MISLLLYLLLLICVHGAVASDIDNDSINAPFDSNTAPSHTKFGTVKDNSNSSELEIKKHRSLTGWKSFSDRDELKNQVSAYCQDPENYNTTEYGPIEHWDTSQVTSMHYIFYAWSYCNPDISKWDVSKVSNFNGMFYEASSFNRDIGKWNVSSGTNFNEVFGYANSFNQAIGDWDVSKGTNFAWMFNEASSFNRDIGKWNVSRGTTFDGMFSDSSSFNQAIGDWDVSKGQFDGMFYGASSFNRDIGKWNVSSATYFGFMFGKASLFNQAIGDWDVSKGTNFDGMFYGASSFNRDIGKWNVSSGIIFKEVFRYANSFNQAIGDWDVSKGTNFYGMFNDASSFNQNLKSWLTWIYKDGNTSKYWCLNAICVTSMQPSTQPTPAPTPAISCDGKNKVQCKKLKKFCVFGKNKIAGKCKPKKSKYKKDCGQFDAKDTCLNESEGNCMWNGKCTHRCDGLAKKKCRKVKNPEDNNRKMCKTKMMSNPCKGCQSKTTCG